DGIRDFHVTGVQTCALPIYQGEGMVETAGAEIVEEQAADTARFVAVLEEEILVAPFLETRVDVVTERQAGGACRFVPVDHVITLRIVGRQVEAATEPPHWFLTFLLGDKETHVGVTGRRMRIAWVNHQRHAHGLPFAPGQFRSMGSRRRWQGAAEYVGKIDAAFLDYGTVLEHA